jgi:hypothetical protein
MIGSSVMASEDSVCAIVDLWITLRACPRSHRYFAKRIRSLQMVAAAAERASSRKNHETLCIPGGQGELPRVVQSVISVGPVTHDAIFDRTSADSLFWRLCRSIFAWGCMPLALVFCEICARRRRRSLAPSWVHCFLESGDRRRAHVDRYRSTNRPGQKCA